MCVGISVIHFGPCVDFEGLAGTDKLLLGSRLTWLSDLQVLF